MKLFLFSLKGTLTIKKEEWPPIIPDEIHATFIGWSSNVEIKTTEVNGEGIVGGHNVFGGGSHLEKTYTNLQ